jgi:hypothetical protein
MLVGYPALNLAYWTLVLKSGVLPIDGDSIGIPIFGSLMVAIALAPIMIGTTWICVRRYNCNAKLFAVRRDRLLRTFVATLLFGGMAIFSLALLVYGWTQPAPWYEYLWDIYVLLGIYWLLAMRAAIVEQGDAKSGQGGP